MQNLSSFTLIWFQICMHFFFLWNTKYILKAITQFRFLLTSICIDKGTIEVNGTQLSKNS